MEEFFEGLSKEDQIRYKRLSKELKETDNIDKMKKYIPKLIILEERGKIAVEKKRKSQER
ncbi:hypothetical protein [Oceanobacillus damuensis]|uniref:hypothetical protein n=1 Tax=Oceanobacillus damuensis TaxID=937928 RepID=UPI00083311A5|nr:hypothetical protein [Oceanobacillus damuensis]